MNHNGLQKGHLLPEVALTPIFLWTAPPSYTLRSKVLGSKRVAAPTGAPLAAAAEDPQGVDHGPAQGPEPGHAHAGAGRAGGPRIRGGGGGPGSLVKFNPLSNVTSQEVWTFLRVMVPAPLLFFSPLHKKTQARCRKKG